MKLNWLRLIGVATALVVVTAGCVGPENAAPPALPFPEEETGTMTIGSRNHGVVQVPNDWEPFTVVDQDSVDYGSEGSSISLDSQKADEGTFEEFSASRMLIFEENVTTGLLTLEEELGGQPATKTTSVLPQVNQKITCWVFEGVGRYHCVLLITESAEELTHQQLTELVESSFSLTIPPEFMDPAMFQASPSMPPNLAA